MSHYYYLKGKVWLLVTLCPFTFGQWSLSSRLQLGYLYLYPSKAQVPLRGNKEERLYMPQAEENLSETLSSGHDQPAALTHSQQLWLSTHDEASQCESVEEKVVYPFPPLTKELGTAAGFWRKRSQFSLRMWSRVDQQSPSLGKWSLQWEDGRMLISDQWAYSTYDCKHKTWTRSSQPKYQHGWRGGSQRLTPSREAINGWCFLEEGRGICLQGCRESHLSPSTSKEGLGFLAPGVLIHNLTP